MEELKEIANAIVSQGVDFTVDVFHVKRIDRVLAKLKLRKLNHKRVFKIKPATMGTLVKISRELLDLPQTINIQNVDDSYVVMKEHSYRLAKIVAYAVVNSKEEPPDSLPNLFMDNLTPAELKILVNIVFKQMDIMSFITSIVSLKGVTVLQTGASL